MDNTHGHLGLHRYPGLPDTLLVFVQVYSSDEVFRPLSPCLCIPTYAHVQCEKNFQDDCPPVTSAVLRWKFY